MCLFSIHELEDIIERVENLSPPLDYAGRVNSVPITKHAYPIENDHSWPIIGLGSVVRVPTVV